MMLTHLRLENFKSWEDTGRIPLKPITGFFGPNSSGKTSLFQALLLLKQTEESPDRRIVFHFGDERTLVDLGDFESVVHMHERERSLKFSLGWEAKRQFLIPDVYVKGTVAEGDEIGFEVETKQKKSQSANSVVLENMVYRIANRIFGMRLLPDQEGYDLFACGLNFNISRQIDETYLLPSKFYHFPYWAKEHFQGDDFLFDLEYGISLLFRDLYYLGPLRVFPHRTYVWSGARPFDVGPAGENAIDAILSSRELYFERLPESRQLTLQEYVAAWLQRLGLVHDFRVESIAEGTRLFEVKVRKTASSPEVSLTDVGFGISQVLPVLVQCLYVPEGSTVVLEQPDIHLHPSVQADLADVFIDAWEQKKVQVLFESHSEHLLRRLQRRIAEGEIQQEIVRLYFCSTDDDGASNLSELELDKFGNISNWPKDFFGDQFGEMAAMSSAALNRQGEAK